METKFLKDLANKPYEVRLRIFWFIMIAVAVIAIAGWFFLIKNYKFNKEINESDFKLPSFKEIVPPNLVNQLNNIGSDIKSLNNNIQRNNFIGNNMVGNTAIGNSAAMPLDNNFGSENNYIR